METKLVAEEAVAAAEPWNESAFKFAFHKEPEAAEDESEFKPWVEPEPTVESVVEPVALDTGSTADIEQTVELRVRHYAEQRASAAPEPPTIVAFNQPSRPWTEVLSAFLDEKNIRWGELVGGLQFLHY